MFDPGFAIQTLPDLLGFAYGQGVFGPVPEIRRLEDIRASLADPACQGPSELYAIAMDVGDTRDREQILSHNLLYGAVVYAAGRLGSEPVRSQGHIHAVSPSCGSSTCEVYEIWEGRACIYMQQRDTDNPGSCLAVYAQKGDVVIVPPGWVHATVNADTASRMSFGAWCVRDYGFVYDGVRAHSGIAYFPRAAEQGLVWDENPAYQGGRLREVNAFPLPEFSIEPQKPIYQQFREHPGRFDYVSRPQNDVSLWEAYERRLTGGSL